MKLVESNVEYIPQAEGLEGIYRQIELAGRTAYKSEDKIVDVVNIDIDELPVGMNIEDIPSYKDNPSKCISFLKEHNIEYKLISSARKFTDMLIRNKHYAALEHGTVYLKVPIDIWVEDKHEWDCMFPEGLPWVSTNCDGDYWYITTNLRHIIEGNIGMKTMCKFLCNPTEKHEKRYTFKFTTDIGICRELLRHRKFSFLNESTRYCNYSKDKFDNEITFIEPNPGCEMMVHALKDAEYAYMMLIDAGWTPQQARAVLPLATKTDLIMTGFSSDWRYLLDLRYFEKTGPVHPDMKVLMQKLTSVMSNVGVLKDIMKYPSKFD